VKVKKKGKVPAPAKTAPHFGPYKTGTSCARKMRGHRRWGGCGGEDDGYGGGTIIPSLDATGYCQGQGIAKLCQEKAQTKKQVHHVSFVPQK